MSKGFNEYRVVRVIGILIFSIGAVVIFFAKILDLILAFADNAIQLAVVRYSNFIEKIVYKVLRKIRNYGI